MPGSDARQAHGRQRHEHKKGDDEQNGPDCDDDGPMDTDRVAQDAECRPEVGPVAHRIERPVEGGEEPHVEDFTTTSRPSVTPKATASTDRARGGRARARARTTRPSTGMRRNSAGVSWLSWFGDTSANHTSSTESAVATLPATARSWLRACETGRAGTATLRRVRTTRRAARTLRPGR